MNFKKGSLNKLLLIFVFLSLLSCDDRSKEKKEFYPNGNLKAVYTEKDNILEGEYTSYYPNGNIASEMNYKKGKLSGKRKVYHKNGELKEIAYLKNGEFDGVARGYTEDGRVYFIAHYKNGNKVGKAKYFYPDGNLKEVQVYGERGKLIYYKRFKRDGSRAFEAVFPVVETESDTITLGENFTFSAKMPLPLQDPYRFFVAKGKDFRDSIPATKIIDDKYYFSFTPKETGMNLIHLGIFHLKEKDTFNIHKQTIEKKFFVASPAGASL